MIRALVGKELRQHGSTFVLLLALLLAGLAAISGNKFLREVSGTGLEGVRFLLLSFVPFAGLLLGQVLISLEFRHKTQLFLEGLPLPRWRMLAVKYALGLAVLLLGVGSAVAVAIFSGGESEAINAHFLLILASKVAGWTVLLYSACFAFSFLGRYRIVVVIALLLGLNLLREQGFGIQRLAPMELVDDRFAYERHHFPGWELTVTLAIAAGLAAAGFLLGLVRDATVASLLAERMSSREKLVFTFLIFGSLLSTAYVSKQKEKLEPVRMPGAFEVHRGPVSVMGSAAVGTPTAEEEEAVKHAVTRLADELEAMAAYLHMEAVPPLFIVHRRDLNADSVENGNLKRKQGLLVRVNLTAKDVDQSDLVRCILDQVLLTKTNKRAGLEKSAWVQDGFARWWLLRKAPPLAIADVMSEIPPPPPRALQRWYSVRNDLGEDKARELSTSTLRFLQRRYGDPACQLFFSSMYSGDATEDARSWLHDTLHPINRRLRSATGVSLDDFTEQWRKELSSPGATSY